MSLDDFNGTVNGFMDPFTSNEYIFTALNIFLGLYGSLAAPKIPVSWSPYLAIYTHSRHDHDRMDL